MRGWWIAGTVGVAFAWILCFVVQAVAGDALPPDISVSQYGVGPHGWLFSVWLLAVAAGPCLLYAYRPVRGWGARWWLLIGLVGAAVMAAVRTDPGGLQESTNAKIHMVGSVLTLVGLPIGMLCALLVAGRVWRRCAATLVAVSAVSLMLLLISAGGVDTTGAGAVTSWSFWQSIAVAADMLLLVALVFGVRTIPPLAGDPEPWWTEHRGGAVRVLGGTGHRRPVAARGEGPSAPPRGRAVRSVNDA